jgi:hypothetical protein
MLNYEYANRIKYVSNIPPSSLARRVTEDRRFVELRPFD